MTAIRSLFTGPKAKRRWIIDAGFALIFAVVYLTAEENLLLHEWGTMLMLPIILTHLAFNWKWIINIVPKLFAPLPRRVRINQVLNIGLFFAMLTTIITGIMISEQMMPTLGLGLSMGEAVEDIHGTAGDLILYGVLAHIALHWKWIVKTAQRYILPKKQSTKGRVLARS